MTQINLGHILRISLTAEFTHGLGDQHQSFEQGQQMQNASLV
jgi:hypothetical protein